MSVEQNRTAASLRQAIGAGEFDHYRDMLLQPDNPLVIKLDGETVLSHMDVVADAVRSLHDLGIYPAIVHGAGAQINDALGDYDPGKQFVDGLRVTDERTLGVVDETFRAVNQTIISRLGAFGVNGAALTDGVFEANLIDRKKYGFVGSVTHVHTRRIFNAFDDRTIPVISSLGVDRSGNRLNVNSDTAASKLADAAMAHRFITLTDTGGVLDQFGNIIPLLTTRSHDIEKLIKNGLITDEMVPQIREITKSVDNLSDSASAVITSPTSLIRELFTHMGEGTTIRKGDQIDCHDSVKKVGRAELRQLIQNAFSKKDKKGLKKPRILRADYFRQLEDEHAVVFKTAQAYDGAAIVLPGKNKKSPAYMDKLAVREEAGGMGIGAELLTSVIDHYKEGGVYWRTNAANKYQDEFYMGFCDVVMTDDDKQWNVYLKNIPAERRAECVSDAVRREASFIE